MTISKRTAYVAILTMGIVSMLGDIVYESGRGITPDYLSFLGLSALTIGLVSGFGEFLGYAARLVTGKLADKSRAYWFFIFLGYGCILAIPLVGVSTSVELVIALILTERLGKALRSPSRDTVVSVISKSVGAGKAFGLHEAIDQIGAIIGPALFGVILLLTANNYSIAFELLIIPFILMIIALIFTYKKIGKKVDQNIEVEIKAANDKKTPLNRHFWLYCSAVFLNTLGLLPVALILFRGSMILQPLGAQWIIPFLYVIVQVVDVPMALVSGHLFDKIGLKILLLPFALSLLPVLAIAYGGLTGVIAACVLFGLVLGMQESIYRAAVSNLVSLNQRGTAYGVFNTVLGVGTLASGAIFGFLMDSGYSVLIWIGFSAVIQIVALLMLQKARNCPLT
ncbi:MAG: MFS transporter [Candidatus Bathyarchaeota archaeon]|nr:MFS transporter [Candidatus Bathyarchaeota archaeon]